MAGLGGLPVSGKILKEGAHCLCLFRARHATEGGPAISRHDSGNASACWFAGHSPPAPWGWRRHWKSIRAQQGRPHLPPDHQRVSPHGQHHRLSTCRRQAPLRLPLRLPGSSSSGPVVLAPPQHSMGGSGRRRRVVRAPALASLLGRSAHAVQRLLPPSPRSSTGTSRRRASARCAIWGTRRRGCLAICCRSPSSPVGSRRLWLRPGLGQLLARFLSFPPPPLSSPTGTAHRWAVWEVVRQGGDWWRYGTAGRRRERAWWEAFAMLASQQSAGSAAPALLLRLPPA